MPDKILLALKTFYDIVKTKNINWVLSGSTSLVIQGVDVTINNDIDILTDKAGAEILDNLLAQYRVKPMKYSETDKYKSYFGIYRLDGIQLEVMGEFQYLLKNGSWSEPNQNNEIIFKDFLEMRLPLLKLEQELVEYDNLDKIDKVNKIKRVIK